MMRFKDFAEHTAPREDSRVPDQTAQSAPLDAVQNTYDQRSRQYTRRTIKPELLAVYILSLPIAGKLLPRFCQAYVDILNS